MADESVCTLQDAMRLAGSAAVDVFAYKVMKSGGLTACRQIAGIAEAAGIASYGGTFLESSIGTSARSEEHTSELQSLMRISYAVLCLKKKKIKKTLRTD